MKIKHVFFVAVWAGLAWACSGENDDPGGNTNIFAGQYIRCNAGGYAFEAVDDSVGAVVSSSSSSTTATISGGFQSTQENVSLYIPFPKTVTDTVVDLSGSGMKMFRFMQPGVGLWQSKTGTIHLQVDSASINYGSGLSQKYHILSGTFSGTMELVFSTSGEELVITNGEFRGHRLIL